MNNQDLVNDILEYINCSMSNWYIRKSRRSINRANIPFRK